VTEVPEATAEATESATQEATLEAESTEEATPEITQPAPTLATVEETPEIDLEVTEVAEGNTEVQVATPGLIILNSDLGTDSIDALRQRTFCRLGYDDFFSWFLPSLVMRGNNIDPSRDLATVTDYADLQELVAAVSDGDCTGAGLSLDALMALQELMPEDISNIRIANETTPFPYALMMYPLEIELGVRLTLNDLFTGFDSSTEAGAALHLLLGQDVIIAIPEDGLNALDAFMAATGLDFAQLGN
jgi:ABC-type phosphate/phosphonate transport system substrate-binding protein